MCNKEGPEPLHSDFLQDIGRAEDISQKQDLLFHWLCDLDLIAFAFSRRLIFFLFVSCFVLFLRQGFLRVTALAVLKTPFRPGWPQTYRDPCASASQVLGLKVCATTAWLRGVNVYGQLGLTHA
jgi:hypothetical protein